MKKWLVIFLILLGVGVGIVSLYMASLSGVMGKMGLYGGDFSQSVRANDLARALRGQKQSVECGIWQTTASVPSYLVSRGESRVKLAGSLGGNRIICGVMSVQNGNIERGVYTIMKGLYYLKNYYDEMRVIVERDKSKCEILGNPESERWIESYLMATEGRIYDVVLELYKEVEGSRARIGELCSE
jgi:hypothetical protein